MSFIVPMENNWLMEGNNSAKIQEILLWKMSMDSERASVEEPMLNLVDLTFNLVCLKYHSFLAYSCLLFNCLFSLSFCSLWGGWENVA